MYPRHTTRRKDGKVHTYWRLVRFVRVGRKVIQQTVAQLSELDAQGRARAKALAQALVWGLTQAELFTLETAVEAVVPVCLDQVRLERGRRFGDVWLGWTLWRALHYRLCAAPARPCEHSAHGGHLRQVATDRQQGRRRSPGCARRRPQW
jgi:hypothetical protein